MEQFGAYYFFEYAEGKHTLVLADAKSSQSPAPGLASGPYNPIDDAGRPEMRYLEAGGRSWFALRAPRLS